MQLRGLVPPSPHVLHSHVCVAAGLPFFHYPIPVRSILGFCGLLWGLRPAVLQPTPWSSPHTAVSTVPGGVSGSNAPLLSHSTLETHVHVPVLTVEGLSSWPASLAVIVYTQAHLPPTCGSGAVCRHLHGLGPHEVSVPAQTWLCPGVSSISMDACRPSPLGLCAWFLHDLDHLCLPGSLLLI